MGLDFLVQHTYLSRRNEMGWHEIILEDDVHCKACSSLLALRLMQMLVNQSLSHRFDLHG